MGVSNAFRVRNESLLLLHNRFQPGAFCLQTGHLSRQFLNFPPPFFRQQAVLLGDPVAKFRLPLVLGQNCRLLFPETLKPFLFLAPIKLQVAQGAFFRVPFLGSAPAQCKILR